MLHEPPLPCMPCEPASDECVRLSRLRFRGMFPHAAGLIASNGPYKSVNDLMKLPGANENDKKLFAMYKSQFVALPPGRTFNERINARQST